jgi:hypothetical protein
LFTESQLFYEVLKYTATYPKPLATMFASARYLLAALAVLVVSKTTTTDAFVHKSTFKKFGVSKAASASSLNMLAEDPKVVMVTGSSRGLGKSIAVDIGSHGHKIIVNYVSDGSKEAAEATVKEIKDAGGDAVAIQADCKSLNSHNSF